MNQAAPEAKVSDQLQNIADASSQIREWLSGIIVGQERVVDELLICLFTGGHALLEGVPGLAKSTLVTAMAKAIGLDHKRVQFTPDMMPADVLGSEVLEENRENGSKSFRFIQGPVFTQVLLADEINRTPPKTQAALLQAMQEKTVSYAGQDHELPFPFLVFATQNPIENEGTYPLPDAQLDRFMLKICIAYPDEAEERRVAVINSRDLNQNLNPSTPVQVSWRNVYQLIDQMPLAETLVEMAVKICRLSRPNSEGSDEYVNNNVRWGAGPRASQYLLLACRGLAAIEGMATPTVEHLRKVALPVLRHRIIPSFSAEAHRITSESVIEHLLKQALDA